MTDPVFLAPVGPATGVGDAVLLDGDEGRHAVAARRLRVGEAVVLTDGCGLRALAVVRQVARGALTAEVRSVEQVPAPAPRLVVVQALVKGDRGERAVELMTELGVDVVVPWAASRCVARWDGERAGRGRARWRATATAAAKQARRTWHPQVRDPADLVAVTGLVADAELALVLHESATSSISTVPVPPDGDVVVVVGPEGGLTDDEVASLTSAGATAVTLGPTVLRASTAGAAAAAVLLSSTPRWADR